MFKETDMLGVHMEGETDGQTERERLRQGDRESDIHLISLVAVSVTTHI